MKITITSEQIIALYTELKQKIISNKIVFTKKYALYHGLDKVLSNYAIDADNAERDLQLLPDNRKIDLYQDLLHFQKTHFKYLAEIGVHIPGKLKAKNVSANQDMIKIDNFYFTSNNKKYYYWAFFNDVPGEEDIPDCNNINLFKQWHNFRYFKLIRKKFYKWCNKEGMVYAIPRNMVEIVD